MEQIVKVHRVLPDGKAEVIHGRESACSGDCHHCAGCGAAPEVLIVPVENPIGAKEGDMVTISSDSACVLKAAVLVYLIPVALFFTGYAMGSPYQAGGLSGCIGFLLGMTIAVCADRIYFRNKKTVYTITGFASESGQTYK